jgi:hypothetical protein
MAPPRGDATSVALERIARVNATSLEEAAAMVDAAFHDWGRRSTKTWAARVDLDLLISWPALVVLDGLVGELKRRPVHE